MNTIWIKARLKTLGKTQAHIAEALSVTLPRASQLVNGERRLDALELPKLAAALEMSPIALLNKLMEGEVAPLIDDDGVIPALSPQGKLTKYSPVKSLDKGSEELVPIRFYNTGFLDHSRTQIRDGAPPAHATFPVRWLRTITEAGPENLAVVRINGDSMSDTLIDGDYVLIDQSKTKFNREGLYAIKFGSGFWVKRLDLNFRDKLIRIISDNNHYPVLEEMEDKIELVGTVIMLVARKL